MSLYGHMLFIVLSTYLGMGTLGQIADVCLTFKETAKLFSEVDAPF